MKTGKAMLVLRKENGEDIVLRENVPEDIISSDVYLESEYFAIKAWSDEDIKKCLRERGYEDADENVECFKKSARFTTLNEELNECTDAEWSIIGSAISATDGLTRI